MQLTLSVQTLGQSTSALIMLVHKLAHAGRAKMCMGQRLMALCTQPGTTHMLAGHDEVALILPVLIVEDDDQVASCYVCNSLRYAVKEPERFLGLVCHCDSSAEPGVRSDRCAADSSVPYAVTAVPSFPVQWLGMPQAPAELGL